jgi:hypothetical protein
MNRLMLLHHITFAELASIDQASSIIWHLHVQRCTVNVMDRAWVITALHASLRLRCHREVDSLNKERPGDHVAAPLSQESTCNIKLLHWLEIKVI